MLIFTDGWSNKGPDVEEMSRNAERVGFTLYTVVYEVHLHSSFVFRIHS